MTTFKALALIAVLALSSVSAFTPAPMKRNIYVPDGLTTEQYQRIKEQEAKKFQNKDLGRLGPNKFKSRSMQAWQQAYERGETNHLMPVFRAKEKLAKGKIKTQDIPYMQRAGNWDNSDVRGAKKKQWSKTDKEYARGGYKKEQSASILGSGPGFDWTGTRPRSETKVVRPGFF